MVEKIAKCSIYFVVVSAHFAMVFQRAKCLCHFAPAFRPKIVNLLNSRPPHANLFPFKLKYLLMLRPTTLREWTISLPCQCGLSGSAMCLMCPFLGVRFFQVFFHLFFPYYIVIFCLVSISYYVFAINDLSPFRNSLGHPLFTHTCTPHLMHTALAHSPLHVQQPGDIFIQTFHLCAASLCIWTPHSYSPHHEDGKYFPKQQLHIKKKLAPNPKHFKRFLISFNTFKYIRFLCPKPALCLKSLTQMLPRNCGRRANQFACVFVCGFLLLMQQQSIVLARTVVGCNILK